MREERASSKAILWLAFITVGCTIAMVAIFTFRAGATDSQIKQLRENKQASICNIRVLKQISASSGATEQQRREAFTRIFQADWLMQNCGFTQEEADSIQGGP